MNYLSQQLQQLLHLWRHDKWVAPSVDEWAVRLQTQVQEPVDGVEEFHCHHTCHSRRLSQLKSKHLMLQHHRTATWFPVPMMFCDNCHLFPRNFRMSIYVLLRGGWRVLTCTYVPQADCDVFPANHGPLCRSDHRQRCRSLQYIETRPLPGAVSKLETQQVPRAS